MLKAVLNCRAMVSVASVLPESSTMISSASPAKLARQRAKFFSSLRVMMQKEIFHACFSCAASSSTARVSLTLRSRLKSAASGKPAIFLPRQNETAPAKD